MKIRNGWICVERGRKRPIRNVDLWEVLDEMKCLFPSFCFLY